MGSNYLSGDIPSGISALKKLEKLSLMDNKLEGEIPSEIAQLSNLEELLLSTNQFTGFLPQEFAMLTKLNTIMVSDNNLSQEYLSVSGDTPLYQTNLNMETATATMDIEKE